MPTMSVEKTNEKERDLEAHIKEKGEALEVAERRVLGKKLRRLQRKRRRLVIREQQGAPKASDEKKEE